MNSHEHRRRLQRRHAAWVEVDRTRKHRDTDAEFLIEFASRWAPYGGPSDEEILVHFGLTRPSFIERLWQIIPESHCAHEETLKFANVYPRRRHLRTNTRPR
jgi:hypothetical protein